MGYTDGTTVVTGGQAEERAPRLLDEVRRVLRLRHYSLRTEQAYVSWIRRFILTSGGRHLGELAMPKAEGFLPQAKIPCRYQP